MAAKVVRWQLAVDHLHREAVIAQDPFHYALWRMGLRHRLSLLFGRDPSTVRLRRPVPLPVQLTSPDGFGRLRLPGRIRWIG